MTFKYRSSSLICPSNEKPEIQALIVSIMSPYQIKDERLTDEVRFARLLVYLKCTQGDQWSIR